MVDQMSKQTSERETKTNNHTTQNELHEPFRMGSLLDIATPFRLGGNEEVNSLNSSRVLPKAMP